MTLLCRARRATLAVAAAATFAACTKAAPAPAIPVGEGRSHLVVQAPASAKILSIDYTLRFWFLGQEPAVQYFTYQLVTSRTDGQAQAILPCVAGPTGSGLNQLQVEAVVHQDGKPDATGTASALFTCERNGDTPVNLVLFFFNDGDGGFNDVDVGASAVSCTSRTELRGDSFLAVCASSSCDANGAAWLFSNSCSALEGGFPDSWVCGRGADWTLVGPLARAQFAIPAADGLWKLGVAALGQLRFSAPDLSLTDAAGNLRIRKNVPTPTALLQKISGAIVRRELDGARKATYAAELVTPAPPGVAAPHVLLALSTTAAGTTAAAWTRFGPCEVPAQGVASWPGLFPVDVRLTAPGAARVILAGAPDGVATRSASCTAGLDAGGAPTVTCTAAAALGGTP